MSEENKKKLYTSNGNEFTKYELLDDYERILQENQQLKEELENNDCKRIYNQFVNYKNWYFEYVDKCEKYKSVLDEIREYIEKDYSFAKRHDIPLLTKDEQLAGKLFEILDRVKK